MRRQMTRIDSRASHRSIELLCAITWRIQMVRFTFRSRWGGEVLYSTLGEHVRQKFSIFSLRLFWIHLVEVRTVPMKCISLISMRRFKRNMFSFDSHKMNSFISESVLDRFMSNVRCRFIIIVLGVAVHVRRHSHHRSTFVSLTSHHLSHRISSFTHSLLALSYTAYYSKTWISISWTSALLACLSLFLSSLIRSNKQNNLNFIFVSMWNSKTKNGRWMEQKWLQQQQQ